MKGQSLFNAVQLVTGLAVVFGLALVWLEMQQTRELTRIQMEADWRMHYSNRLLALAGENPMKTMAKAIDRPTELTTEDLLVVDQVIQSYMDYWSMLKKTADAGLVDGERWLDHFDGDEGGIGSYFGHPVGRGWWETMNEFGIIYDDDPEFHTVADRAIQNVNPGSMLYWQTALRENFAQHAGQIEAMKSELIESAQARARENSQ